MNKVLNDLRISGVQCDTSLKFIPADTYDSLGQKIEAGESNPHEPAVRAPKILLYAISPYFRALFTTWQNSPRERDEMGIPGVPYDVLQSIVEYAYTRETQIDDDNVEMLLKAADQLMIEGLVRDCENYVISVMCCENCIGFRKFGTAYFCRKLAPAALSFLLYNFEEIATVSEDLLELSLEEILELFRNDYLNVGKEEVVWRAVLRWLSYDESNRIPHTALLLKTVRLGLLNAEYIADEIEKHLYVSSNRLCLPVISEAISFLHDMDHLEYLNREVTTPDCAIPRYPHDLLFAIGGWSDGEATDVIEMYDTRADRWTRVADCDPLGPRAYHRCVVIGHEIYVIGGFNGPEYFRSCRCFNVVTRTWREIAPMNCKRCYVSVAQLEGFMYAIGGYNGQHRQNSVEKYDFSLNQWSYVSPMHFQRSDACATTLNGLIYITGGFDGQTCLDSVECYDPSLDEWVLIPSMNSPRSGVSCVTYQSCLFVVGGFNGAARLRSCEMLSTKSEAWVPIPDMRSPRSNFGIQVVDDMIFVIGGYNGLTTIFEVEYFDIKIGQWSDATDMSVNRSALDVCLVRQIPNPGDYAYPNRDQLTEEKRRYLIRRRSHFASLNTIQEDDDDDDTDLEDMTFD